MVTGRVFDIQTFCLHDGPGIRTTVFLKGCPLRCLWCHNPESRAARPQLAFTVSRCVGCGACVAACPQGAHALADGRHRIDRSRCRACGGCAERCPSGALELVGRDMSVAEALDAVLPDRPFYDNSGGGMTVSGGEPLAQSRFTAALLRAARGEGLHCCLETCGLAPWADLARLAPLVDLFLYDLKETDDARHVEYTGVSNAPILANLRALDAAGAAIRLRLPLVPGYNDRADHFDAVAALARELKHLEGVEVIAYHALGRSKIARFGLEDEALIDAPTPGDDQVQGWLDALAARGVAAKRP